MRIPYHQFGQSGPVIHFGHANGYPPVAYRQLFDSLSGRNRIVAMRMRPLWPGADPFQVDNWLPLAEDLEDFFRQEGFDRLVGAGHSMGATTALRLALRSPQVFSALILIDPVLFSPNMIYTMRLIHALGLSYRLNPLVNGALRRRRIFESKGAMFENYRNKEIFRCLDDAALQDYVEALARLREDGQIELDYSPEWEARIYATGVLADMDIWRSLGDLKPPLLVMRGENSDTFRLDSLRLLRKKLPKAQVHTVPDSTHLVALERPAQVSQMIQDFLSTIL
jgi:pimeloyl-ACP methyl ester carboxylesterase